RPELTQHFRPPRWHRPASPQVDLVVQLGPRAGYQQRSNGPPVGGLGAQRPAQRWQQAQPGPMVGAARHWPPSIVTEPDLDEITSPHLAVVGDEADRERRVTARQR